MDFLYVIFGSLATISMMIGLLNNGFIFFYLKKKLPIQQTAFDLVVADNLILLSVHTSLTYILYILGLVTCQFPYELSVILPGLNQILYMAFNASALVTVVIKCLFLEHGVILFNTSDATIRKLSWISVGLLTFIYCLINNYGPRNTSPFLFTFLVKDETIER